MRRADGAGRAIAYRAGGCSSASSSTNPLPRRVRRESVPARRRLPRQATACCCSVEHELRRTRRRSTAGCRSGSTCTGRTSCAARLRAAADPHAAGQFARRRGASSIAQGALVKAVNLFKMPSSDPFTMRRDAADDGRRRSRPSGRAVDVGGLLARRRRAVERTLYRPQYFDKIVAWGGGDAINNVIKYLGPGLPAGLVRSQDLDLDDRHRRASSPTR